MTEQISSAPGDGAPYASEPVFVRWFYVIDHDEREELRIDLADGEEIIQLNTYGPAVQGDHEVNVKVWIARRTRSAGSPSRSDTEEDGS